MGRCFRRPWKQQEGPDAADAEGEPESASPAASGETQAPKQRAALAAVGSLRPFPADPHRERPVPLS